MFYCNHGIFYKYWQERLTCMKTESTFPCPSTPSSTPWSFARASLGKCFLLAPNSKLVSQTDFETGIGQFHFEAVVCLSCNSPLRRQPHPGPREALPRPVHALPEHDPDALEVGRGEDADPVADDPAGEPRSGTGHGGHPPVPLRTGPRQAAAHLSILGKRLTSLFVGTVR